MTDGIDTDGVFVAGTDTGIGKTVVAAGLTRALRREGVGAHPYKPVESGGCGDAEFLASATGDETEPKDVCPYVLDEPLAPKVAAEHTGRELDYSVMADTPDSEYVVVEGVGGLRVPLTPEHDLDEFLVDIGLPALVVARPDLGTLNHTALTVEALRERGVSVVGVFLSRFPDETEPTDAEHTNPDEIERMNDVPVRALPELKSVTPEASADALESAGVFEVLGL